MPATTTFATLLSELAEELDLGLVISAGTGATTTITESDTGVSELRGPFSSKALPIGSPVSVITGGTVGEDTYVSDWNVSTGVVTLSPAITTGATGFIIWKPLVKHAKNIEKAVSRAHQKCHRVLKVPLTFVPDGEMLAATVADYWTASAGTGSYQSLATPEVAGRVLQISHSSAANIQSNTIPARAADTWYFETAIRATTDTDTATFTVQDILNSTTVSVTYQIGDGATTSRAFQTLRGVFTIPGTADTDARIAFRLAVSGSGTLTAQMAPLIAYPQNAQSFPFTNRVLGPERIGNFYYAYGEASTGGPDERAYSDPITTGGKTVGYSHEGDHIVAHFNFAPVGPVYYDELVYGGALTAMADTTILAPQYVKQWAKAEIYDFLMRGEMLAGHKADNGAPLPSLFRPLRNAAVKEATWSQFEPELLNVVGRR